MQPQIPPPPVPQVQSVPQDVLDRMQQHRERREAYYNNPDRADAIERIMTQAYGTNGRTLSDAQADQLLDGWKAAFRGVATEHLEELRTMGLERNCKTSGDFVTVYVSWIGAMANEAEYRAEQKKLAEHREQARASGEKSAARARMMERYGISK